MTAGTDQQTARVNVDDRTWRAFRILAIDADRSIADYLGQLIRDELRRARRRSRDGSGRKHDTPDAARAEPVERKRAPVRLADAQLLTGLPHPGRRSRPVTGPPGMMEPDHEGYDG